MSQISLNYLVDRGLRGNRFAAILALGEATPMCPTARSIAGYTNDQWRDIMSRLYDVAYA